MKILQYTSPVTSQYRQETQHRKIKYNVQENLAEHPDILNEFKDWRTNQPTQIISFRSAGHPNYPMPLFDIRNAEIREDWGQRNALLDKGRYAKILGMAKNFNVKLFEPISIDYIPSENKYIIRDGGGRAHAAFMNGIFEVPAYVREIKNHEESRELFMSQDQYAQAIGKYDKFLQQLADVQNSRHNMACDTFAISKSGGFCLHNSMKSNHTPLVEGIGILQRIIRKVGGDPEKEKWGNLSAPNLIDAVDILKVTFPNNDEIPVSVLFAVTAFIKVTQNRIPSGTAGKNRLIQFFEELRDSKTKLSDINNWVKELKFDSSNHYDTYGASALMAQWNQIFKHKNRGSKPKGFYKYVIFKPLEIEIIGKNIITLARDENLYS